MEELLDRLALLTKAMLTPRQRAMTAARLAKCDTKEKQCDALFCALKSAARGRDGRGNGR